VKIVQQWRKFLPRVYDAFFGNRWGLLPSQKIAISIVLEGKNLLLIAPTGAGKTEAVVAPLAERALDFRRQTYAIYIAPTRALANDLEVRLKERLERCGLRLAIRHGERNTVQGKQPPAFILTTPESLEVMLSVMPDYARERLKEVRAVVVDEVHQFFGARRGLQLACLLERLKHHAKHPLQRLGLSATVAEPERVARFLQGSDEPVQVVSVKGQRQLQVYISFVGSPKPDDFGDAAAEWLNEILADHRKVLVFANTRATCDWLCWQLSERLPVPVLLHYSSLHRDYREWVEKTFRQARRAVCVATSTLELGIDIGDIDAVAFWGAPHSVTSFLQRLGRGNRRTDTSIVYAACPQWHPSGALADPDDDLLRFVALTYCALNDEMETRSEPRYYSVLLQQLLALCCRYGRIAPDAFVATISHCPPFCDEKTLADILDALTERGILERDVQQDLWLPDDTFHAWQAKGLFWSNIGGQESAIVFGEGKEQPIPLAEIPAQYARGLRHGKVVVLAGKPRLVTRVESQSVWVTDLEHEDAELAKYFAPPEPTPKSVAQAIRSVLTIPHEALKGLPINYDDWASQQLIWWRQHLCERLQGKDCVTEGEDGRWVLYTFAGSVINWLLGDFLNEVTRVSADANAWRISCPHEIPLGKVLRGLNVSVLERLVERRWRNYLRRLELPPLFHSLPTALQKAEIFSVLDLKRVTDFLSHLVINA
jgi:ATP-dependent Lhr-like helicase